MRFLLMVKQVPDTDATLLPDGRVSRRGPMILNPHCEYALDAVSGLKDEDDELVVMTMGPPSSREALFRCLELGADRAYHLCDGDFAGSDVWATANILARAITTREPAFDLLVCGERAADGDTGLIPSMLAAALGMPQVTGCLSLERDGTRLNAVRRRNGRMTRLVLSPKTVVSVSDGSNVHRLPSLADLKEALGKPIVTLTRNDLGMSMEECGVKGSFTRVRKVYVLDESREGIKLSLEDTDAVDTVIGVFRGDQQ